MFWNQNFSVLIDGIPNEQQNLYLDVRIIYSFQMTIHWETARTVLSANIKQHNKNQNSSGAQFDYHCAVSKKWQVKWKPAHISVCNKVLFCDAF